jgi:hypothetical protein
MGLALRGPPLAFALCALTEAMGVTGPARIVMELLATFVVFGALGMWVRTNRLPLELIGDRGPGRRFREPACPAENLDDLGADPRRAAATGRRPDAFLASSARTLTPPGRTGLDTEFEARSGIVAVREARRRLRSTPGGSA